MLNNKTKKILIILNFILLFVLTTFSAMKEEGYKKREGFYLELSPVDPRSLMQGDYMILNYKIVDQTWEKINILKNEKKIRNGYIVVELDENNVAQFKDVVEKPFNDDKLLFISFKLSDYDIKINVDTFLFQEGDAKLYENAKYSRVVLVENTLRLIGLVDELPKK